MCVKENYRHVSVPWYVNNSTTGTGDAQQMPRQQQVLAVLDCAPLSVLYCNNTPPPLSLSLPVTTSRDLTLSLSFFLFFLHFFQLQLQPKN